jgi:hypothetical protein
MIPVPQEEVTFFNNLPLAGVLSFYKESVEILIKEVFLMILKLETIAIILLFFINK